MKRAVPTGLLTITTFTISGCMLAVVAEPEQQHSLWTVPYKFAGQLASDNGRWKATTDEIAIDYGKVWVRTLKTPITVKTPHVTMKMSADSLAVIDINNEREQTFLLLGEADATCGNEHEVMKPGSESTVIDSPHHHFAMPNEQIPRRKMRLRDLKYGKSWLTSEVPVFYFINNDEEIKRIAASRDKNDKKLMDSLLSVPKQMGQPFRSIAR